MPLQDPGAQRDLRAGGRAGAEEGSGCGAAQAAAREGARLDEQGHNSIETF